MSPDRTTGEPSSPTVSPLDATSSWQDLIAKIPEQDKTPLVRLLLAVIADQAQRLAVLEAENARLRDDPKPPASNSKPSGLNPSATPTPKPDPTGKRPGSIKRSKTKELPIHHEVDVPPENLPPDAKRLRREAYVVQDLIVEAHNTRYWLETWLTPTGEELRGQLPQGVRGHFGPGLLSFVMQQHYAAHVPQCRIREELLDFGIDVSAGQVNNIITEHHEAFHAEKDALLPTGLEVFTALSVDDSGAPHQGQYGSCLCIGNEFFTTFHSSATKERAKFLDVLRCGHVDLVLNAWSWQYLKGQGLPAKIWRLLRVEESATEASFEEQTFADASTWNKRLDDLGIDNGKHRQMLTEAALLGSAIVHGAAPDLGIVSDGSPIYDVFVHGLCWIHQERNLMKLTPCGNEQCQALESVRTAVWQLYEDLKAYRLSPNPAQAETLRARFDAIVQNPTCWPELNAALERMAGKKAGLLAVLDRPDLPLHTNTTERDFRDWATKRKISAGTRSELGKRCRDTFLSLKSSCKKLGIRFWTYLQDRVLQAGKIPNLSELIREKAGGAATI
jgi:Transposase IS66 family